MNSEIISFDLLQIYKRLKRKILLLEGKTLVVTGGGGFLGNYIIEFLKILNKQVFSEPCKVICIDNYITSDVKYKSNYQKAGNITFINHDICLPISFRSKIDYVIHAAGIASPIYYRKYPIEAIEVNTLGTKHTLELARRNKVKSYLYFSTSEVYGNPTPENIPTLETYRGNVSSTGPRSCYDESKRLGEALVVNYFDKYKTPVKIVRPFNIYGPGMRKSDYRVIPTFLYNALSGKNLPVHEKGTHTRTYCYIADATVSFIKVLLSSSNREVYNVGNDKPEITTFELAKLVRSLFNKNIQISKIPFPKNYPQDVPERRCPDLTKIKSTLRYKPHVGLKERLQKTAAWMKEAK